MPVLSKLKVNVSKTIADLRNEEFILGEVLTSMFKFDWIETKTDKKNALQILKEELKGLEYAIREEN